MSFVVQGNAAATAAQMKQQIQQLAAAAAAAASAYPAALAAQLAAASSGAFQQDFAASALAGSGGLLPYSTSQGMALPEQNSGACRSTLLNCLVVFSVLDQIACNKSFGPQH